ncbi:MAG TPA: hypothetical protein VH539_09935 [Gemmatimonadaceae bacterium]
MSTMLLAGAFALLLRGPAPVDPSAQAILDTALAHMGGATALGAVERMRLEVMTEWQRVEFAPRRAPVILSYELSTELRDYTIPAWRYSRRFYSPNGTAEVIDLVTDSVAATAMNGRWRPQNIAYVDERDEVFTFAPERVVRLARDAADARTLADTAIGGERYARVVATIGKFMPTLYFRRSDGLPAFARFRAGQPNDFGLAPWGAMDVEIAYSRWQKIAAAGILLPMQIDVSRVGRPYKRMTTISVQVNPTIPADSLGIPDSLRTAFLATARRPMFDLPMDSARIAETGFAVFGTPGAPGGAVKIGGRWVMIEAGTAPLSIERSAAFLHRVEPTTTLGGALITAPTGAGGVAWLAKKSVTTWVTAGATPFAEAALRGWGEKGSALQSVKGDRWLRVGSDSLRVETIDLPDYPGTAVVYVPALRWAYAWPAGPAQMDYVIAHARRRGWTVDRIGSVRDFIGVPVAAARAASR